MVKRFYERSYPAAWDQYQYLAYRLDQINRQLEILLLITGVFFAAYSFQAFSDPFVFLPSLVGFALIYLLSLYFILPRLVKIPWVGHYDLEFENYRKKGDIEGFYKQLVTETYKYEYDLRFVFKRKKKLLRYVIVLLIFSTFLPISIIASNYSQFFGLIILFYIIFLIVLFYKRFGTYLLQYFKEGDVPGKGTYICLFCRKGIDINDEAKLTKCDRCGEVDYVKKGDNFSFSKFQKFLMLAILTNIILLWILDGPIWGFLSITLWILFYLSLGYISFYFFKKYLTPIFDKLNDFLENYEKKHPKKQKEGKKIVKEYKNRFYNKFYKKCPHIFSFLITLIIIFILISPISLLPSFMSEMTHYKATMNESKVDDLVSEITKFDKTEEEKTLSLLSWFDAYSDNIFNDYQMGSIGIGKRVLVFQDNIEIFSGGPILCIRTYNDNDALWVLTSKFGHCGEYALLFRRMAFSAGLEVRKMTCLGENHCWNEVKINGNWVIVDPTYVYLPEHNGYNLSLEFMENKFGGNVSYVEAEYLSGRTEDETSRYSDIINITLLVKNNNSIPYENVEIELYSNNRDNVKRFTGLKRNTNETGHCIFSIGGGNYTFKCMNKEFTTSFNELIFEQNYTIEV